MIFAWMIDATLFGVLVALCGWCATHLLGRWGMRRRWIVLALMLISALTPVALAVRSRPAAPAAASSNPPVLRASGMRGAAPVRGPSSNELALALWLCGSLATAVVVVASHRRMIGELVSSRREVVAGVAVLVVEDLGPAAVGLLHPVVVLPEWALELPADEQQLVVRHELQHIAAGDHAVLLAGVMLGILAPWNLAIWWQLRRLRIAIELDCDGRVAATSQERPRYARLLLRVRESAVHHPMVLALASAPSALGERLLTLLDERRPTLSQLLPWLVATIACAFVATRVPVPDLSALVAREPRAVSEAGVSRPSLGARGGRSFMPVITGAPVRAGGRVAAAYPTNSDEPNAPRAAPVAPTVTRAVAPVSGALPHPRYDSLIPYEPLAGGATGGGVRGGMAPGYLVRKSDTVRATLPTDSLPLDK